jgi:hypothetical protein
MLVVEVKPGAPPISRRFQTLPLAASYSDHTLVLERLDSLCENSPRVARFIHKLAVGDAIPAFPTSSSFINPSIRLT